ncbi:MAG: hypothetical protein Fur0032_05070 [Terrimicrobiaceae bacterium]
MNFSGIIQPNTVKKRFLSYAITSLALWATNPTLPGGQAPTPEQDAPRSFSLDDAFEKLWSLPVLYKSETNPYVQRVAFTGRYQGQLWGLNSDYGSASGWENRRQRLGARIDFLEQFQAHITFNLNFDGANTGRFFETYEDFGLKWNPAKEINLDVGLFKVPITNEWRASSNVILTIERSDFINMAVPPKLGGILASGETRGFTEGSAFTYGAGLYTAARGEDWAAPTFNGGAVIYSGVGYRFNDNHELRFDSGILTGDSENNAAPPYSYTAALSYAGLFLKDKLSLQSDLVMGIGAENTADLFGIIILPSYRLTDRIELVARYQYLASNESDGVQLQRRYERRAPDLPTSLGNHYQAVYGGINYYIYKNRMKIMGGLEYSHMNLDNDGAYNQLTLFGAFRVWF